MISKNNPDGDILTSGEVARMCGVCRRTVVQWTERGLLRCHRLPGCEYRRFRRSDVVKFMAAHGIVFGDPASAKAA